jgi:hypothetical protein
MPSAYPEGAKASNSRPLPDLFSTKSLEKVPFEVGVGRADITPPPGASLAGHGPGGRVAIGHWTRLGCRAFYIDPRGESQDPLALVSCELPQMSTLLVRDTLEELRAEIKLRREKASSKGLTDKQSERLDRLERLSATRLMIAATHTHAGPAHFFDSKNMGGFASSHFPGFDKKMARFLAQKVAAALLEAAATAKLAEFREVTSNVWSFSRNSAIDQFRMNKVDQDLPTCREDFYQKLLPDERAIDPRLRLLEFRAAAPSRDLIGVMAFYALHPSFLANQNRHFGGDIFGVAARSMELELKREACLAHKGEGCDSIAPAFAFFNTNEADAQPRRVGGTRDEVVENGNAFARAIFATHRVQDPPPPPAPAADSEPRSAPEAEREATPEEAEPEATAEEPRAAADQSDATTAPAQVPGAEPVATSSLASSEPTTSLLRQQATLTAAAAAPGGVEKRHCDEKVVQPWTSEMQIASAYVELDLPGAELRDPFFDFSSLDSHSPLDRAACEREHTAELTKKGTMGHASMVGSASNPSALLFLTPTTIEMANWRFGRERELVAPKRSVPFSGGAAKTVPVSLVQLGGAFLSFIPAEVTLAVGNEINRQVGLGLESPPGDAFIVGLANGYISYLTTADEYQLQAYHGGSTLYGRESSQYFSYAFGCLARHLKEYDGAHSAAEGYVPPKCGPHLIGQARAFKYKTGPKRNRLWTKKRDRSVRECALEGQGKESLPTLPCKYEQATCEEKHKACEAQNEHLDCSLPRRCHTEQAICRLPEEAKDGAEESQGDNREEQPPAFCFRWRDRGPFAVMGDRDPFTEVEDEDWLVRAVATQEPPGAHVLSLEFASEPLVPPVMEPQGTSWDDLRSAGQTAIDDRGIAFTTQVKHRKRGAWEWSTVFRPSIDQWKTLKKAGVPHLEVRQFSPTDDNVTYLSSPPLDDVAVCTAETLREYCPNP